MSRPSAKHVAACQGRFAVPEYSCLALSTLRVTPCCGHGGPEIVLSDCPCCCIFDGALLADTKFPDHVSVTIRIARLQIVEQAATLAHQHQETTTRAMVFLVSLEVLRKFADPFTQDCDLNLGTPRIRLVGSKLLDEVCLPCRCQHSYSLLLISKSLSSASAKDSTA